MSVLSILAAILVLGVIALLLVVISRPDSFRLERAATIAAPPETVYALIADFRRWAVWSPWDKMDSALKRTYGGADSGVGATYGWEGDKTGVGRMEIIKAIPGERLEIKLDFIKPFEAHNIADFKLTPTEAGGTRVTWAMYGPQPFMAKLMSLVFSTEKMVGPQFDQGLADLKAAAESGA